MYEKNIFYKKKPFLIDRTTKLIEKKNVKI